MTNKEKMFKRDLKNPDEPEAGVNNEALERMNDLYQGNYEKLFLEAKNFLGDKITIHDYHDIYVSYLDRITYNLCQNIQMAPALYNKEMAHYKGLRQKLDEIFILYAGESQSKDEIKKILGWRMHLNEKSFLFDDGERVVRNLNETVAEYVEFVGQPVTSQFIKENFKTSAGNTYSDGTCNEARNYANTNKKARNYANTNSDGTCKEELCKYKAKLKAISKLAQS